MENKHYSKPSANQPTVYQIRIKGHLGQQRMDWFGGFSITLEEDGSTLLRGLVVDQSALHGMLKKVRDLGMPLLSLYSVGTNSQNTGAADQ